MADISKLDINGVSYNIKDATARQLIEELKTNGGGTGSGGGNGVADWAQNDPAGEGYIKNRTHYSEEVGGDVLIEETSITFSSQGANISNATAAADSLAEDDAVLVFWNGTKYTCKCFLYYGFPALGNGSLSDSAIENTGEPFLITFTTGGNASIIKETSDEETVTLKVGGTETVYHPLDGNYLPTGTPWIEKGGMVEILPEYTITEDNAGADIAGIPALGLVAGNTYTVKCNGTEYTCVAWEMPEEGMTIVGLGDVYTFTDGGLGTAATGEPFILIEYPPEAAAEVGFNVYIEPLVEMSLPIVFSIVGGGTNIHKLDNRCLDLAWLPTAKETLLGSGIVSENTPSINLSSSTDLTEGQTLKVIYGGTEYLVFLKNTRQGLLAGNLSIVMSDYEDTGEPFIVSPTVLIGTEIGAVSVYKVDPNVLPEMFLPGEKTVRWSPYKIVFDSEGIYGVIGKSSWEEQDDGTFLREDKWSNITADIDYVQAFPSESHRKAFYTSGFRVVDWSDGTCTIVCDRLPTIDINYKLFGYELYK